MTELKPCPVCGSDNLYVMTVFPSGNHVFHCMDCHTYYDKLELTREDTRSDMLNKWNEYAQNYKPEPKSEPELKPCPFCGSTEIHTYELTIYEIGNDASVNCENPICGAEVRGDSLKEAIAKWNRRVKE